MRMKTPILKNKFSKYTSLLFAACYFFLVTPSFAMCPVCTVGVVAGLGLSRWLGIDDIISGIWIGGLLMSVSAWTENWMRGKKWNFKGSPFIITIAYYAMVVIPLYMKDIIGHPFNTYWGIDKLILGIIFGSFFFFAGALTYKYLKKANGGHAHFPFEKVVLPISPLIILSIIFYFITKNQDYSCKQ